MVNLIPTGGNTTASGARRMATRLPPPQRGGQRVDANHPP